MNVTSTPGPSGPAPGAVHAVSTDGGGRHQAAAVLPATLRTVHRWWRRSTDRQRLGEMDPRLLRDMGVSPHDLWLERRKWFWQA